MTDFIEINDKEKTIKSLNLENLSLQNLKQYIDELYAEIERAKAEINLKKQSINEAEKYFK